MGRRYPTAVFIYNGLLDSKSRSSFALRFVMNYMLATIVAVQCFKTEQRRKPQRDNKCSDILRANEKKVRIDLMYLVYCFPSKKMFSWTLKPPRPSSWLFRQPPSCHQPCKRHLRASRRTVRQEFPLKPAMESTRSTTSGRTGEHLGNKEWLGQKALRFASARTTSLSSSESSSIPKMAMMSCKFL